MTETRDEKLQELIEALLLYADSPTKAGSKHCRYLISEFGLEHEDQHLKQFLERAYQAMRPYKAAPRDIRNLILDFNLRPKTDENSKQQPLREVGDELKTVIVIDKIMEYLGARSERALSRYIGASKEELLSVQDRPFNKILLSKIGKRLDDLLYVIECMAKDKTLGAELIHRLLTLPAHPINDGWLLDVISAIHQEHDKAFLIRVLQSAIARLRCDIDGVPIANGLYRRIHLEVPEKV